MNTFAFFAALFFSSLVFADLGPQLGPDDNICPDALIKEVSEYGKGDLEVIKSLIPQTSKGNINCVSENQGITALSYLAETYHNETMRLLIEQVHPNLDLQSKVRVWGLGGLTTPFKGETAMMTAATNGYIASDTMVFYLLNGGANADIQEEITGQTALIAAADEAFDFNTVDPKGQYESSTEYRDLMYLRLFGASPNLQGWTRTQAPYKGNYADTVFHKLARNRTGVEILSPFRLLIEPRSVLTYEHFTSQLPKDDTHVHVTLTEARFSELLSKMPAFDPRVLCLKDGAGRTVFDEIRANVGVWDKKPVLEYLSRFVDCSVLE